MSEKYSEILEEKIENLEKIIEDLYKDREVLVHILKNVQESGRDISQLAENCIEPINPVKGKENIVREVMIKKLLEKIKVYNSTLDIWSERINTPPRDYRLKVI